MICNILIFSEAWKYKTGRMLFFLILHKHMHIYEDKSEQKDK